MNVLSMFAGSGPQGFGHDWEPEAWANYLTFSYL